MTLGMTSGWLVVLMVFVGVALVYSVRRRIDVPCTVDLESSHDHFHAHVDLQGMLVDAGDEVLVHGTPSHVPFGTQRSFASTATVQRASWLRRQVVKLTGGTELYELYDVGFEG